MDAAFNVLPLSEEPEFIETEITLDTGATIHAADRADFPAHELLESVGSKAGEKLCWAVDKLIPKERMQDIDDGTARHRV